MECINKKSCLNNDKCFRCVDYNLLKLKKQRGQRRITGIIENTNMKSINADNSWEDLEQQVADKLNNIPTIQEARRSRASGAKIFKPLAPILVKVCPVCYYK